jgi:hypothetical protein
MVVDQTAGGRACSAAQNAHMRASSSSSQEAANDHQRPGPVRRSVTTWSRAVMMSTGVIGSGGRSDVAPARGLALRMLQLTAVRHHSQVSGTRSNVSPVGAPGPDRAMPTPTRSLHCVAALLRVRTPAGGLANAGIIFYWNSRRDVVS